MRIGALANRIIRQFFRDKRSLAMMFVAPMLILLLMSLVFNGDAYKPEVALVNSPEIIRSALLSQGGTIHEYSMQEAEAALVNGDIDAIISSTGGELTIKLEGSNPATNKALIMMLQKIVENMNPNADKVKLSITYLHGSADMTAFDNFGPVLVGFFSFFFVFLLSGVAFLRERTSGTLERLLATPIRRWEIVVGYLIGFGIFAMIQSALIAWFSIYILGILMEGAFWLVLICTLSLAMTALTLGTFISAFANNEFQMVQFIPLVVVPQVFFSGLFNMDTMADWLRGLSYIMPLSYGADALRGVMIRGEGWSDIAMNIYILLGLSLLFILANIYALRKHRKI
jgi:ABC-2 type transport system permease protein